MTYEEAIALKKVLIEKLVDLKVNFEVFNRNDGSYIKIKDKVTWDNGFHYLFNEISYEQIDEYTFVLWLGDLCFNEPSNELIKEMEWFY